MTSEPPPQPDPRRKRALAIGGVIALAAIGWNFDGWSDDDHVRISDSDREEIHEARDAIRDAVREEIRAGIRGEDEAGEDEAAEDEADAEVEEDTGEDSETAEADAETGEPRVVETESGENQRSFRIEGDDGRGVTISIDADTAE